MNGMRNKGFSLLEVMIAMTVFAIFITGFMVSLNNNEADSISFKNENFLNKLCQNKLNEVLLDLPELEESLTLTSKTGNFDEEGYPDYEYKITYKRFEIPNLNFSESEESKNNYENKVFELMEKNFKELIWQVEVQVKKKGTDFPAILSTWIYNKEAKVEISL